MAGSQIATSVTIINSLLGFQAVSLTNMGTAAAPVIAAGSKVEIAGAFFTFKTDETPDAATWTAISTTSTAFITATPSGVAGSQTVALRWSAKFPTWSDSKQGWYDATTTSIIRYIGYCYKGGATSYPVKGYLGGARDTRINFSIGEWNMDLYVFKEISLSSAMTELIYLKGTLSGAMIYSDIGYPAGGGSAEKWNFFVGASSESAFIRLRDSTNKIFLRRETDGIFDSTDFDGTKSTVVTRGYVMVDFQV